MAKPNYRKQYVQAKLKSTGLEATPEQLGKFRQQFKNLSQTKQGRTKIAQVVLPIGTASERAAFKKLIRPSVIGGVTSPSGSSASSAVVGGAPITPINDAVPYMAVQPAAVTSTNTTIKKPRDNKNVYGDVWEERAFQKLSKVPGFGQYAALADSVDRKGYLASSGLAARAMAETATVGVLARLSPTLITAAKATKFGVATLNQLKKSNIKIDIKNPFSKINIKNPFAKTSTNSNPYPSARYPSSSTGFDLRPKYGPTVSPTPKSTRSAPKGNPAGKTTKTKTSESKTTTTKTPEPETTATKTPEPKTTTTKTPESITPTTVVAGMKGSDFDALGNRLRGKFNPIKRGDPMPTPPTMPSRLSPGDKKLWEYSDAMEEYTKQLYFWNKFNPKP